MPSQGGIKAGKAFILIEARDKTAKVLRMVGDKLRQFGRQITAIGQKMVKSALMVLAPVGLASRVFAGYDDSLRKVEARSSGTAAEMAALREQAKELGRTTSFTAGQVGELQAKLAQKGFNRAQILAMTGDVLNLAVAAGDAGGEMDAILAADVVSGAIRAFRLEASEAGRVADVMTAAVNNSNFSMQGLVDSLKSAAPIAKRYNLSLEETIAVLAGMTNVNIDASSAGMAFRNMLLRLSDEGLRNGFNKSISEATGKTIDFVDEAGDLRSLPEILFAIGESVKDLGSAEQGDILGKLFGTRAVVGAGVVAEGENPFGDLMDKLLEANGLAARTRETMDAGLGGGFRNLWSAVEGVAIAIGEAIEGPFNRFLTWLQNVTGNITAWVQKNQQTIQSVAAVAGGVALAGVGLIAFGTALKIAGVAVTILSGTLATVTIAFRVLYTTVAIAVSTLTLAKTVIATVVSLLYLATTATVAYRVAVAVTTAVLITLQTAAVYMSFVTLTLATSFSIVKAATVAWSVSLAVLKATVATVAAAVLFLETVTSIGQLAFLAYKALIVSTGIAAVVYTASVKLASAATLVFNTVVGAIGASLLFLESVTTLAGVATAVYKGIVVATSVVLAAFKAVVALTMMTLIALKGVLSLTSIAMGIVSAATAITTATFIALKAVLLVLLSPIGFLVAAVVGLIYLFFDWQSAITSWASAGKSAIGSFISGFMDLASKVKEAFSLIVRAIKQGQIEEAFRFLGRLLPLIWDGIMLRLGEAWGKLLDKMKMEAGHFLISSGLTEMGSNLMKSTIKTVDEMLAKRKEFKDNEEAINVVIADFRAELDLGLEAMEEKKEEEKQAADNLANRGGRPLLDIATPAKSASVAAMTKGLEKGTAEAAEAAHRNKQTNLLNTIAGNSEEQTELLQGILDGIGDMDAGGLEGV